MKPIYPAVKAVIVKDGKFLALKKRGVEGEVFELPGGRMNYGETHGEALFREVYEETKLQVQPFILYDTWEFFHEDYQITGVIYLVEMPEEGEVVLSDEHEEYRFLPLEKESLNIMDVVFSTRMERWDFEAIKGFMRK
ncbi:NUDIX hydrolase [Listeria innocua]|uniref:Lin1662 protein n=1 Tax=Listeria innocua serovar 6a (strain ATCC BAA-680 / CLIP 11262) TaxID=272626 RepID=Q92B88_LISIN|nr:NUDIX domain-containing protein [Listeria innocua]EFR90605.1 MutT/nudix family protein [Listeria innocua FSL S4-378]MWW17464.1 NUDIX domain-containing protein [Listeria monocytogenes]EAA0092903.1 NUDIX domain-containing protein [Listeria innocua]EAC4267625.1 NUDIX domain-containing protein [Listeria innocua]EAD5704994.1 NUDIX domain-containing protein [Listeria innocua]